MAAVRSDERRAAMAPGRPSAKGRELAANPAECQRSQLRNEIALPRDREFVGQIHSIKRRVIASGKVSFDAEGTTRGGHADRFWAIALACQTERGPAQRSGAGGGIVTKRLSEHYCILPGFQ